MVPVMAEMPAEWPPSCACHPNPTGAPLRTAWPC